MGKQGGGARVSSGTRMKGLEVCHVMAPRGTSYGVWVKDASHTILERLTLHDNQGPGLFIDGGTGGHLVLNCDSYNNYDPHSVTGPGQNADGFGCHYQKPGPSTVFRGCRAWWNSDDGYDWFKQEVPVIIEHCWAMGSGYTPNGAGLAASGNGAGRLVHDPAVRAHHRSHAEIAPGGLLEIQSPSVRRLSRGKRVPWSRLQRSSMPKRCLACATTGSDMNSWKESCG